MDSTVDTFRAYANAIWDELPEAINTVESLHILKLGLGLLDDVRCQVRQDTLGHRGRNEDSL